MQIEVNGTICDVDEYIFRSWTGKRFLNGKRYYGPRYILGTNELIPTNQKTAD